MKYGFLSLLVAALVGCGGGSGSGVGETPTQLKVTTLAGGSSVAGFEAGHPERRMLLGTLKGAALDAAGNVYVAHAESYTGYFGYSILKIAPGGAVAVLAGFGTGYADGTGATARFLDPRVGGVDAAGNIYVADTGNNAIRKISPAGVVSTLAGGVAEGFTDGSGPAARFNSPSGLALDAQGNVYVADTSNNAIRKITPGGAVSTLAGSGAAGLVDGVGGAANFNYPRGLTVDPAGNVYVADFYNFAIRKVSPAGAVQTLAGSGYSGNLNGMGPAAAFARPSGVAVGLDGALYIADTANNLIRKITPEGFVSTYAGVRRGSAGGFKNGAIAEAEFSEPESLVIDAAGTIFVTDSGNGAVRKISSTGVVSSLVGRTVPGYQDGAGSIASFGYLGGGAIDQAGNVFVADYTNNVVRKVSPLGVVSTFAGSSVSGSTDGVGIAASFTNPISLTIDAADYLYVASGTQVRKVSPIGTVTTLVKDFDPSELPGDPTHPQYTRPHFVASDRDGNIYLTDQDPGKWTFAGVWKVTPSGVVARYSGFGGARMSVDGVASQASFSIPTMLATDLAGAVYVVDDGKLRKIAADGVVSTVSTESLSVGAFLVDEVGNIYFSNTYAVYKRDPNGVITLVAGGPKPGYADGPASKASFAGIGYIAIDRTGRLYVFDSGNGAIRVIAP